MKIRPQLIALLSIPAISLALGAAVPQDKKGAMPGGEMTIDAVHSTILFKCKHLDTSWQFGRFNDVKGTLTMDAAKPEGSKVEVTVAMDSIDTNNKKRDSDLLGPNFFDSKQFPTATFKSKTVAKKGDKVFAVTGDLMLHGVTKTVTIDMENTGSSDKMGPPRVGFYGVLDIKRSDYGIKAMADMLGDDVQLTLTCEATSGKGR